jgi:hypothetical protein
VRLVSRSWSIYLKLKHTNRHLGIFCPPVAAEVYWLAAFPAAYGTGPLGGNALATGTPRSCCDCWEVLREIELTSGADDFSSCKEKSPNEAALSLFRETLSDAFLRVDADAVGTVPRESGVTSPPDAAGRLLKSLNDAALNLFFLSACGGDGARVAGGLRAGTLSPGGSADVEGICCVGCVG